MVWFALQIKWLVSILNATLDLNRLRWLSKSTNHGSALIITFYIPVISSLNANPTKWSNILKQFAGSCRRIVWVFDHFVKLALKRLMKNFKSNVLSRDQTKISFRKFCTTLMSKRKLIVKTQSYEDTEIENKRLSGIYVHQERSKPYEK